VIHKRTWFLKIVSTMYYVYPNVYCTVSVLCYRIPTVYPPALHPTQFAGANAILCANGWFPNNVYALMHNVYFVNRSRKTKNRCSHNLSWNWSTRSYSSCSRQIRSRSIPKSNPSILDRFSLEYNNPSERFLLLLLSFLAAFLVYQCVRTKLNGHCESE